MRRRIKRLVQKALIIAEANSSSNVKKRSKSLGTSSIPTNTLGANRENSQGVQTDRPSRQETHNGIPEEEVPEEGVHEVHQPATEVQHETPNERPGTVNHEMHQPLTASEGDVTPLADGDRTPIEPHGWTVRGVHEPVTASHEDVTQSNYVDSQTPVDPPKLVNGSASDMVHQPATAAHEDVTRLTNGDDQTPLELRESASGSASDVIHQPATAGHDDVTPSTYGDDQTPAGLRGFANGSASDVMHQHATSGHDDEGFFTPRDDKIPVTEVERSNDVNGIQTNGVSSEDLGADYNLVKALDGILDLNDTTKVHQDITHAPAVTHETVRPQVHEIVEEQIHREIHNHDVYHQILPVYDLEVLPARHFVRDADGGLVEMSESDFPEYTGANQRWYIGERLSNETPRTGQEQSALAAAKAAGMKKYTTPEGFERTDQTIVHPPTLAEIPTDGLLMPIQFLHYETETQAEAAASTSER
ncbi:Uu.00g108270.m01.CDS01 [Anthostomella pinea]|uniref:Uu.00g108270.m01.CDS01 n=1 Tax=Anthostomella pinea TaxID=933095 RepID=A0AAI8YFZ3_9PEZI|nr:Uu.00g108270.m01.CDS01 [Anthostomella pinea]